MAHKWAAWLHIPCHPGGPKRFKAGQNQRWPTISPGGYLSLATWGFPNVAVRGTKSQVAHKRAGWLHSPCRLWGPQRFRAGDPTRDSPQYGRVAT